MNFKHHFIIGLICASIITYVFNLTFFTGLIIFLSSWLIDIDHYFWYALEFKDLNPFNALRWRIKSAKKWKKLVRKERFKFKQGVFIFHSVGFWAALIALTFLDKIFLWILIGIGIHMIIDFVDLIKRKRNILEKISLAYVVRKNKNRKSLREL